MFCFLVLSYLAAGCDSKRPNQSTKSASDVQDPQIAKQVEQYEAHIKKGDEQIAKVGEQIRRYDAILDKWEEQGNRLDRILTRFEKSLDEHGAPRDAADRH
jgi:septal ring factor EnvC (AmiA/AmiB activator)